MLMVIQGSLAIDHYRRSIRATRGEEGKAKYWTLCPLVNYILTFSQRKVGFQKGFTAKKNNSIYTETTLERKDT